MARVVRGRAMVEGGCTVTAPSQNPELESGECCFCETQGEHINMMSEQLLQSNQGNYVDMVLACFNVFLATGSTASPLICASCACRLRDAHDFRQLVLRAHNRLCAATSVKVEVNPAVHLKIKSEPEEPPGQPAEPDPDYYEVVVKSEPDIEIVEHGLTRRTDLKSGVREWCQENRTDKMLGDGQTEPKKQRLEKQETTKMDTILTGLLSSAQEPTELTSENDQNLNLSSSENADKFLEEYYKRTPYEEEDTKSDSLFEMPDKDAIDFDQETLFLNAGCGCKNSCLEKFNRNEVLKSRLDCLEQDYYCYHNINHLHLITLGAISATARLGANYEKSVENEYRENNSKSHVVFMFRGVHVCKKFFLFAHGIRTAKYERILKYYKTNGLESLAHGCKQVLMTKQQRADLIAFINNFSEQNSLVLPGRSPTNTDLHILPSSISRTAVYERYVRACKRNNTYPVSRPLWYKSWDSFCPDVVFGLAANPCKMCDDFVTKLSDAQSEDDKKKWLRNAIDHLNDVQIQKGYYQNIIAQVAPGLMMNDLSLGNHNPCSYEGVSHYSFDYLQQVHLPHNSDQTTPQGFLESYKVSLFGIAVEPLNKFVLYVIPEYVTKGMNLVISLLHHFFQTFALGETHVVCHATNRNKNDILIQYALWRVLSGLHKSFQLSFLPSGHEKFAPDVYFGQFKSKFRQFNPSSLTDIREIAANTRSDISCVIFQNEPGKSYVYNYDWEERFKAQNPPAIPKLHSYCHFKMDSQNPLAVMCSKSSPNDFTDAVKIDLTLVSEIPNIIEPQELSLERQKYLYENIRKYVAPAFKDILCPAPRGLIVESIDITEDCTDDSNQTGSKVENESTDPMIIMDSSEENEPLDDEILQGEDRKNSVCSYCGGIGHMNDIKQGVYVCAKRQLDIYIESKVPKKCEYCIPNDVYNSILDPKLKEVYMENCKCKNDITENNDVAKLDTYDQVKVEQTRLQGSMAATEHYEMDPLDLLEPKEEISDIKTCNQGSLHPKETSGQGTTKRKSTCSYCGKEGHRNQIRFGFYHCQKRLKDEEEALKKLNDLN